MRSCFEHLATLNPRHPREHKRKPSNLPFSLVKMAAAFFFSMGEGRGSICYSSLSEELLLLLNWGIGTRGRSRHVVSLNEKVIGYSCTFEKLGGLLSSVCFWQPACILSFYCLLPFFVERGSEHTSKCTLLIKKTESRLRSERRKYSAEISPKMHSDTFSGHPKKA